MQVQYYQDPMHTVDPNFELKIQIVLEKVKKLNHISSVEYSEKVSFLFSNWFMIQLNNWFMI
jgi:hypothetical protein